MIAVGCWILTTWLELVGTGLGNWAWAPATALPFLTMGNPPTGIAGGYCVLDVLALRIGQTLVAPGDDQGAAGGAAGARLTSASVTTGS